MLTPTNRHPARHRAQLTASTFGEVMLPTMEDVIAGAGDFLDGFAAMDESQMVALVYRELRRIGPEGEILIPDVHDWWQILMGLGRKWFYPDSTCPNLLDEDVDWKKLMGQYYEKAGSAE